MQAAMQEMRTPGGFGGGSFRNSPQMEQVNSVSMGAQVQMHPMGAASRWTKYGRGRRK